MNSSENASLRVSSDMMFCGIPPCPSAQPVRTGKGKISRMGSKYPSKGKGQKGTAWWSRPEMVRCFTQKDKTGVQWLKIWFSIGKSMSANTQKVYIHIKRNLNKCWYLVVTHIYIYIHVLMYKYFIARYRFLISRDHKLQKLDEFTPNAKGTDKFHEFWNFTICNLECWWDCEHNI